MKKVLIDMVKLRDYANRGYDGIWVNGESLEKLCTIREEATFRFTCRRCKDAPCVDVCPAEALEKDADGRISRNVNLCVRCKSCISICPFGTLMADLFDKKDPSLIYSLNDDSELDLFIKTSPGDTVFPYEGEEDPSLNIFKLNERIMIRDYTWKS